MSYIKADTQDEQEIFDYLEELRQSGDTNMFGAIPYLQEAFVLSYQDSRSILSKWMKLHRDPTRIMDAPITKQKPHKRITRFEREE